MRSSVLVLCLEPAVGGPSSEPKLPSPIPQSAVEGAGQGLLMMEWELRPLLQKMEGGGIDAISTAEETTEPERNLNYLHNQC